MFLLKKILSPLFMPVTVLFLLWSAGMGLLLFARKERWAKRVLISGLLLLGVLGFDPIPNLILKPLEGQYPPMLQPESHPDVKFVAVLGGGHVSDPEMPENSQLDRSSLKRLVEGIRLHRAMPGSRLVLSGGGLFDPVPHGKIMALTAKMLGVDSKAIIVETAPKDTKDEAVSIRKIVGTNPFFLVTTAAHMPRSIALFKKQGARPIPAPTDFSVKSGPGIRPHQFFPKAGNLRKVEIALHEYLGIIWAKLRGQI